MYYIIDMLLVTLFNFHNMWYNVIKVENALAGALKRYVVVFI